jgi:hypothetical protein
MSAKILIADYSQGVAAVLAYIFRLEQGQDVSYPSVEVPSDMRFNEFGRPMG